jgi:hypothetical protein
VIAEHAAADCRECTPEKRAEAQGQLRGEKRRRREPHEKQSRNNERKNNKAMASKSNGAGKSQHACTDNVPQLPMPKEEQIKNELAREKDRKRKTEE